MTTIRILPAAVAAAALAATLSPAAIAQATAPPARTAAEAEAAREVRRVRVEQREVNKQVEHVRREMRAAERELERASARVAELAQQLAAEDIELALDRGLFRRPVIGIVMGADAEAGVRVAAVTPQGPSAKAGLRAGDRLTGINGTPIAGADAQARLAHARALVGELEQGQKLRLAYERDGKSAQVEVAAEAMAGFAWVGPEGKSYHFDSLAPMVARQFEFRIGDLAPFVACEDGSESCAQGMLMQALRWRQLRLAEVDPGLGRYFGTDRGVLVLKADSEELDALQPGDVIVAIEGTAVDSPAAAMDALRRAEAGSQVAVEILRDHKRRTVSVVAPEARAMKLFSIPEPPAPPAPPRPPRPATPPPPPPPVESAMSVPPAPPAAPVPPAPAAAPPPPARPGVLESVLL